MDYLSGEMIDPSREPSLYEQLSNHTMEISTLKEADLCGSSNMKERIFVTTIHKAKGLEFDNVIIFDASTDVCPTITVATTLANWQRMPANSTLPCRVPSIGCMFRNASHASTIRMFRTTYTSRHS